MSQQPHQTLTGFRTANVNVASSLPGLLPPPEALTEPYVNLSADTAPLIQPYPYNSGQCANSRGFCRAIRSSQWLARRRCPLSRLNFRVATFHETSVYLPRHRIQGRLVKDSVVPDPTPDSRIEHIRKCLSNLGSRACLTAIWAIRSDTAGIPRGRVLPSLFGITTRLTGGGR